jgi:hypothetical protein
MDNAISEYLIENNTNDNEILDNRPQRNNRQPTKRSSFRIGINKMRLEDGTIAIISPKMSSWYVTYVSAPQMQCKKFNDKFQRCFGCCYSSYQIILAQVNGSPLFFGRKLLMLLVESARQLNYWI